MVENKIAVDRNHAALKRILASLVAMAGWTATGGTFLRARGDAGSASTLPRHLYVAILRLLRPAEAATRRLVIVLARGISVTLPPLRAAKPKPGPVFLKDGKGTGIVDTGISLYRLGLANVAPPPIVQKRAAAATRPLAFPLLDPLRNPFPRRRPRASRAPLCPVACTTSPGGMPFGCGSRRPMTRSTPRVSASALQHLPLRWTTCRPRLCASRAGAPDRDRMRGQPPSPGRFRRIWPLRPGRPPGGRLSRFDPVARRLSRIREVDEVLAHAHAMALYALEQPRPDTS